MPEPILIQSDNLSTAWCRALLEILDGSGDERLQVLLRIADVGNGPARELKAIRTRVDGLLSEHGKPSVATSANTIFPSSLWNPRRSRDQLFERYPRILPKVRRLGSRDGTYFERLTAYGYGESSTVNQLDHIIQTYRSGNHRRSALQAALFNPRCDHTHQRQRGFPCLDHVFFTPNEKHLDVTAVYAMQYLFDRAYGNYLGLCQLGWFVAHEMGLELRDVTCFAAVLNLGTIRKRDLRALAEQIRTDTEQAA